MVWKCWKYQCKLGEDERIFYPTLLWDDNNVILVDTGFPGASEIYFRCNYPRQIWNLNRFDKIIITHQDIDHIGGLPDILNDSDHKIQVLSHEDDKPYIEGDKEIR